MADNRDEETLLSFAHELDAAERNGVAVPLLSTRPGSLTEEEAWSIAALRDGLRAARGEVRSGYKLGWTSEPMRQALGIAQPNFGSLWQSMQVPPGPLDLARLIHPKAEPEFAFRANAPLSGRVSVDDVVAAGEWAVAIEVVDPRWPSFDFDWLDNTADGSSAARYVVGDFRTTPVDPALLRLAITADDVVREGSGEVAMGSPAAAVAWLVARLHERGSALEPGMIVLTGGITAPVDLAPGLTIRVSSPELGEITAHCTSGG